MSKRLAWPARERAALNRKSTAMRAMLFRAGIRGRRASWNAQKFTPNHGWPETVSKKKNSRERFVLVCSTTFARVDRAGLSFP